MLFVSTPVSSFSLLRRWSSLVNRGGGGKKSHKVPLDLSDKTLDSGNGFTEKKLILILTYY